ncbi:MAG: ADP-ribosylglycohydrolase family protein [Rhodospirillales bacterium]|nr:ADP-ribosylglycohydrolase family protein [Rhodospirillales bacterium]MCB9996817.1 ADP-ribosylglycohydrolase family protein [Rhodospirillales bacterium]
MTHKAPHNIHQDGPSLFLPDHYKITLGRLGHAPSAVPAFLYFTFCGDLLGSSGEHYEKGRDVSLHDAAFRASHTASDDFMESLAMSLMAGNDYDLSLSSLMRARDDLYTHLEAHFERFAMTYSPWFRPLFDAATEDAFLAVTAAHSSCGAAMRSGVLGAMDVPPERILPLMLCSHAHAGAIEGAFLISGMARYAAEAQNPGFEAAFDAGLAEAAAGRALLADFLETVGMALPEEKKEAEYKRLVDSVFAADDPYATIKDISVEGIETAFVVPAALYLLKGACAAGDKAGVRHIIEGGLRIGGDPDTICSIAMGLYGAMRPEAAHQGLDEVRLPQAFAGSDA